MNDASLPPAPESAAPETLQVAPPPTPNLPMGIAAGAVAAVIGALAWATVTIVTNYQIGWMAIGIGFLTGFAVRKFGRGSDQVFGITGAALALAGCVLGNILVIYGLVANQGNNSYFMVMKSLPFSVVAEAFQESFSPMDILFYGFALYQGYKVAKAPEAAA